MIGDPHTGSAMMVFVGNPAMLPPEESRHPNTPDILQSQELPSHLDSFMEAQTFPPTLHKVGQSANSFPVTAEFMSSQVTGHVRDHGGRAGQSVGVSFVGDPSSMKSHRRLYNHPRNISIDNQPLILLPKARLQDDRRDLLRTGRAFGIVPQNGLENLQLTAISATSGWLGVKDAGGRASHGRRLVTAFRHRSARKRERSGQESSSLDAEILLAHRPTTVHPLTTRRGKIAALYERMRSSASSQSDISASADSGIGSTRRSTLDKCTCDVIKPRVSDDVTRPSSKNGGSTSDTIRSFEDGSDARFKDGDVHDRDSVLSVESHVQDYAHPQDDDSSLPEHLDSFADVADMVGEQMRKRQMKKESVENFEGDVFDDKWHNGHDSSETCPYCREFERATRRRVDRYFGGAESFLNWIFSKWGKRKELEGMARPKFKLRRRMPHFCNFVHSVNLHQRYSDSGGGRGKGSTISDDDDNLRSMGSDPADKDLKAQWRRQSRLTQSGTEGRPGSPISVVDGAHMQDSNALLNGTGSDVEEEDALSRESKLIPTITIPSFPIPPADQGPGAQHSSGENSPRKSTKNKKPIREPIFDQTKPKPLPTSKPEAPQEKDAEAAGKGKRGLVSKKTKKNSDRKRKGKFSTMEGAEAAPAEQAQNVEPAAQPPPAPLVEVDIKVPDLPGLPTSGKDKGKHSGRGEKHAIPSPLDPGDTKPQLPLELLELSRNSYDFGDMEDTANETAKPKFRSHSWLNNRMALSQQSSRFELPMDMKSLEKMSTQDYLKKYCIVTSRRLNLYQKIFMKHKDKTNHISRAGLETCLKEVLIETLRENTLSDLYDLLELTDEIQIDFKLFSGVAALAERILYPYYTTGDTLEKAEYQREKIETADFGALDWKLNGVNVSDNIRKLLKMIQ